MSGSAAFHVVDPCGRCLTSSPLSRSALPPPRRASSSLASASTSQPASPSARPPASALAPLHSPPPRFRRRSRRPRCARSRPRCVRRPRSVRWPRSGRQWRRRSSLPLRARCKPRSGRWLHQLSHMIVQVARSHILEFTAAKPSPIFFHIHNANLFYKNRRIVEMLLPLHCGTPFRSENILIFPRLLRDLA